MATASRTAIFTLEVKNDQAKASLTGFRAEIENIKKAISDLATVSTQLEPFKRSATAVKGFIVALTSGGKKYDEAISRFSRISDSFDRIAGAVEGAARFSKHLDTISTSIVDFGAKLRENVKDSNAASSALGAYTNAFDKLANLPLDNLKELNSTFSKISNAIAHLTSGNAFVDSMKGISDASPNFDALANSVDRIAAALKDPQLVSSLGAIKQISNLNLQQAGQMGGAVQMPDIIPRFSEPAQKSVEDTLKRIESGRGTTPRHDRDFQARLGELEGKLFVNTEKIHDIIEKWKHNTFTNITDVVNDFETKIKSSTLRSPPMLLSPSDIKSFMSTKGGENIDQLMSMFSGSFFHGWMEDIFKSFDQEKILGEFIEKRAWKSKEWLSVVKEAAFHYEQQLSGAIRQLSSSLMKQGRVADAQRITSNAQKLIAEAVQRLESALGGRGSEKSVFATIAKILEEKYGKDTAEFKAALKQIQTFTETQIRPFELFKSGSDKLEFGDEIIKSIQQLPASEAEAAMASLNAVKSNLIAAFKTDSEGFKKFISEVKARGLYIQGIIDLLIKVGESYSIIDWKNKGGDVGDALQQMLYQLSTIVTQSKSGEIGTPAAFLQTGKGGQATGISESDKLLQNAVELRGEVDRIEVIKSKEVAAEIELRNLTKQRAETAQISAEAAKERNAATEKEIGNTNTVVRQTAAIAANAERAAKSKTALAGALGSGGANIPPTDGGDGGGKGPFDGGFSYGDPKQLVTLYKSSIKGFEESTERVISIMDKFALGTENVDLALSKYVSSVTAAALKQYMFGENIDLVAIKMSEMDKLISKAANVFSEYVLIHQQGNDAHYKSIASIERLVDIMKMEVTTANQVKKSEQEIVNLRKQVTTQLDAIPEISSKIDIEGFKRELMSMDTAQFFETIDKMISKVSGSLTNSADGTRKVNSGFVEIGKNVEKYYKIKDANDRATESTVEFSAALVEAMKNSKSSNAELNTLIGTLRTLDKVFDEDAKSVENVADVVNVLSKAFQRSRSDYLGTTIGVEALTKEMKEMRAEYEKTVGVVGKGGGAYQIKFATPGDETSGVVADYRLDTEAVLRAQDELAVKIRELTDRRQKLSLAEKQINRDLMENKKASAAAAVETEKFKSRSAELEAAQKRVAESIHVVSKELSVFKQEAEAMKHIYQTTQGKTAEAFRADIRTTLKGFRDMMTSQAAWVAGYGAMFAVIGGFKEALASVVNVQHELARAMRTARSEVGVNSEVLSEYARGAESAMIKFGRGIESVTEVLYVLGSAGLTANEAISALDSTLNLIVGTEGDITETTELVAGVYNNFKNEIVGVTSAQEKFEYINDIIVKTFERHQVMLNELTDGYKYLLAMGKASNLTFVQMSGILGTLNDNLIKSGIAGRSMQTVLSQIAKDSGGFARTFNIGIDPNQPLNLMNILAQLNEKIKSGAMTVGEIGDVFDEMGLRGARTLIVLAKNYDTLTNNINRLKNEATDSAETMAEIMLDKPDVAFNQLKQSLMAIVRDGFEPLVSVGAAAATTLGKIAYHAREIGSEVPFVSDFVSTLLKGAGLFATIAVTTRGYNLIARQFTPETANVKFVSEYVEKIKKGRSEISKSATELAGATRTLFTGDWAGLHKNTAGLAGNFSQISKMNLSVRIKNMSNAFQALSTSIFGAKNALYAFVAIAAAYAAYKLIDYLVVTNKEYLELVNNIKDTTDAHAIEVKSLKDKIEAYKVTGEYGKEYIKILEEQLDLQNKIFESKIIEGLPGIEKAGGKALSDLNLAIEVLDNLVEKSYGESASAKKAGEQILGDLTSDMSKAYINALQQKASIDTIKRKLIEMDTEMSKALLKSFTEGPIGAILKELDRVINEAEEKIKSLRKATETSVNEPRKDYIDLAGGAGTWDELIAQKSAAREASDYHNLLKEIAETEKKLGIGWNVTTEEIKEADRAVRDSNGKIKTMAEHSVKLREYIEETMAGSNLMSAEEVLNIYAANELRETGVKLEEELRKELEKYIELLLKKPELFKKFNDDISQLTLTMEKHTHALDRQVTGIMASMVPEQSLSELFTIDDETVDKSNQIKDNLEKITNDINNKYKNKIVGEAVKKLYGGFSFMNDDDNKKILEDSAKSSAEMAMAMVDVQMESRKRVLMATIHYLVEKEELTGMKEILAAQDKMYAAKPLGQRETEIYTESQLALINYRMELEQVNERLVDQVAMLARVGDKNAKQTLALNTQIGVLKKRREVLENLITATMQAEEAMLRFAKIDYDIAMIDARTNGALEYNKAVRETMKVVTDLQYRTKRGHSVAEELAKFDKEQLLARGELNDKITEQTAALRKLELEREKYNDEMSQQTPEYVIIEENIRATKEKISALKIEKDLMDKLIPIERRRLEIQSKITAAQEHSTLLSDVYVRNSALGEGYNRNGAFSDLMPDMSAEKAWESFRMEREFELEKLKEANLLTYEQYVEEVKRLEIESDLFILEHKKKIHEEILALKLREVEVTAEANMRTANTSAEFWNAALQSANAGFVRFYNDSENVSKAISDISYNSLSTLSSGLSELTMNWVRSTEDGARSFKEIMHDTLMSISEALMQYAMKLLIVAAIHKIIGIAAGGMGGNGTADSGVGFSEIPISNFSMGPGLTLGSAKGNVFSYGNLVKYGLGGVVDQQTYFLTKDGKLATMAEKGQEAIMPLVRTSSGELGVRSMSEGNNKYMFNIIKTALDSNMMNGGSTRKPIIPEPTMPTSSMSPNKEPATINNITIKTNDVNSFREAVVNNRNTISGVVVEDLIEAGYLRRR